MTSILKVSEIQDPTNSNTALTIDANGNVNIPGHVVQVVSATKTDTLSTSSDSFVDVTGLSVNITPSSATSKIFVTVSAIGAGTINQCRLQGRLVRDSTPIFVGDVAGSRGQASFEMYKTEGSSLDSVSVNFFDAPATTSSVTYKLQVREGNGTASSVFINRSQSDSDDPAYNRYASTITVMEIAQ